MAIDRLMVNIRFKRLKSLRAKREIIKNKGKVKEKASFLSKKSLKRKKIIRDIREIKEKITDQ